MSATVRQQVRQRPSASSQTAATWVQLGRYWGVAIAWMGVISLLSSDAFSASNTGHYIDPLLRWLFPHISNARLLFWHTVLRKSAHVTEFFVLGLLLFWASRRSRPPRWRPRWMVQSLAIAAIYSLLDEAHQMFVPSRTPSLLDSAIDLGGAALSQVVLYLRGVVLDRGHMRS
ncbi:MAG TPA: VanZ family protein [Candidatus Binatia bacterium]|nr:VanZ family protein [Candidatus Binatia bacterium]